jgi:ubiquinone/menaquinone biosynthesis C-methylase UbiE
MHFAAAAAIHRLMNASLDPQARNADFFRTADAAERYSVYRLTPNEKQFAGRYYKLGDSVLDLACGAARTTLRLHEIGMRVKGIDISETLIDLARRRFPYLALEQGTYLDIREPDASWDHVLISFNGLDYAYPEENRLQALRECRRVLKPAGTLIFSSHNIKSFRASPCYLKRGEIGSLFRHAVAAFRDHAYLMDGRLCTFCGSPAYIVRQTEAQGFEYLELIGFRNSANRLLNTYAAPFIYYAFRKR